MTRILVAVMACILAAGCMRAFEYKGDAVTDTAGDTLVGDTTADGDPTDVIGPDADAVDTAVDADAEPDPHSDDDGDGFSEVDGDCDDGNPRVNPAAWDAPPDGVDDDCNGIADDAVVDCDCEGDASLVAGLDLCDPRFLVSATEVSYAGLAGAGRGMIGWYGSGDNGLAPRAGCGYAVLDTGAIEPLGGGTCAVRQPGTDFYNTSGMLSCPGNEPDPDPAGPSGTSICDTQQLVLELVAPSNATGFSLALVFISSEYPEWVGTEFLDTYYTLFAAGASPAINVTTDPEGNAINVSSTLVEDPPATSLAGTGYHEMVIDSTSGATVPCGSSTGWLRTSWHVDPGQPFTLTLSIHDEGDGIYDSLVILDAFRWEVGPFEAGTARII